MECPKCHSIQSDTAFRCSECGCNIFHEWMDQLSEEEREKWVTLIDAVGEEQDRGYSRNKIIKQLNRKGWPQEMVATCLDRIEASTKAILADPGVRKAARRLQARYFRKLLIVGALLLGGGLIATRLVENVVFWGQSSSAADCVSLGLLAYAGAT